MYGSQRKVLRALQHDRFSVRKVRHQDGSQSYWIFTPDLTVHRPSLKVLARYGASTQQTYAYSLVDHLNWLLANGKTPGVVSFEDLQRYMNGVTGQVDGVYGAVWRKPTQKPLGPSAAGNVASVVKAYYLALAASGEVAPELAESLRSKTAAGQTQPGRMGQVNPLAPKVTTRRPRFLPDETVQSLFEPGVLTSARDVMILTWLHDGGIRVGGLCGLRFSDLHLRRNHECGQRADPHIHVIGREDNPNGARAKAYGPTVVGRDGCVVDGVIRAVSPDMISTFHAYLLDEFHPISHLVDHEQVLVHLAGRTPGAALTTAGVRKMLARACQRAGLPVRVTPHGFRHKAAAALYAESDFNAELVAQEFGWASPQMVSDLYGKSANRHAMKYFEQAWEATARPASEAYLAPEPASKVAH